MSNLSDTYMTIFRIYMKEQKRRRGKREGHGMALRDIPLFCGTLRERHLAAVNIFALRMRRAAEGVG